MCGLKPAVGFGAAANGLDDKELLVIHRVFMANKTPAVGGASLTARLAVHGDPLTKESCAPALMWHRQLWAAEHQRVGRRFDSAEELGTLWETVQPNNATTWRASKGPLARMILCLRRIGWRAKFPAVWVDDQGAEIWLRDHSPKMVEGLLAQGVQRMHERAFARKVMGESWTSQRATVEPLQALLRSKRYAEAPLAKHYAVAYLLDAVWSEDKLETCGYNTDGNFPLCEKGTRLPMAQVFPV